MALVETIKFAASNNHDIHQIKQCTRYFGKY